MRKPVYLDNNATTPVDERVLEVMLPFYREQFGNAASVSHSYGLAAAGAVKRARVQVADLLGARPEEIVWTSGATESNNLALKGVMERYRDRGCHLITCTTEHKAVLDTCKYLEMKDVEVTYLPVDSKGMVNVKQLKSSLTDRTILISLMAANNETGVLHPIEQIGAIAREHGIFFHCDATQAVGKIPLDVKRLGIDLLSLSAHKMYGPKGVGALYVSDRNPRVRPTAVLHGGGHERGMRSGTLNVPGIVGLGKAAEICTEQMGEESRRLKQLADRLYQGITNGLEEVILNGDRQRRLGHTLNLSFAYIEGESLMMDLRHDVAVSSASACTSATLQPSYVLRAMGVSDELAHGSIRFSLGRFNTAEEIDYAAVCVVRSVRRLREVSPLYEAIRKGDDTPNAIQR